MSENTEEIRQDLLDIRHFAERMLSGLYANDPQAQTETLHDLAKLIQVAYHLPVINVLPMLISIWNGETRDLRGVAVSDDETRQTVFRIIGEIFGKYGLPDPGYEGDEL